VERASTAAGYQSADVESKRARHARARRLDTSPPMSFT
jgi:hypothetical protein